VHRPKIKVAFDLQPARTFAGARSPAISRTDLSLDQRANLLGCGDVCADVQTVPSRDGGRAGERGAHGFYGDNYIFFLPATRLRVSVSHKRFVLPGGKEDGRGTLPDHEALQTTADDVAHRDAVLEYTLLLMAQPTARHDLHRADPVELQLLSFHKGSNSRRHAR
jgi:hypothetical protein